MQAARAAGADRVLTGAGRGRGRQMNTGAAAAVGDVLCFLHADTRLDGCDGVSMRVLAAGAVALWRHAQARTYQCACTSAHT